MTERNSGQRRDAAARDLAASGGRDTQLEIVKYDPVWPDRFTSEAARLHRFVPELTWHHIGSTAIPGMAAKPIIDIMALTDDLDTPIQPLTELAAYQFPEAYNAALNGRRWLCRPSAAHRTHHLHLVSDAGELDRHLRFRDALRADDQLAEQYSTLKADIARRMPNDREGYTSAKTAFVRHVEQQLRRS